MIYVRYDLGATIVPFPNNIALTVTVDDRKGSNAQVILVSGFS
jgi:hypothetical protein